MSASRIHRMNSQYRPVYISMRRSPERRSGLLSSRIRLNISERRERASAKYECPKKLVSTPVASIVSIPATTTNPLPESPARGYPCAFFEATKAKSPDDAYKVTGRPVAMSAGAMSRLNTSASISGLQELPL